MMRRTTTLAAALLATSVLVTPAQAQTAGTAQGGTDGPGTPDPQTAEEEIIVTGIRASQARAIDVKRESDSIVDAISAEDIGKLPDVTITDALQRISGVQITRSAGEGATANIRGLPQVVTLLNGEQYLSAASLGAFNPNLNDVPAQLMSGVVVYKSQDLRNALSGISGTIDLRTRRPFDFRDGVTLSGQAELQTGRDTRENDIVTSGLVSWRRGNFGALLTAAYSDLTLGNNYSGDSGQTLNNSWGGDGPNWYAPHGYEVFNREVERKRFGVSGALQWESGDGLRVTAEGFYTRFIEHDLRAGMNISNRWTGLGWTSPDRFTETSIVGPNGQPVYNVEEYGLDAWWVNSFSVARNVRSESKNFNVEVEWDNGGPLSFTSRAIYADANFRNINGSVQGDLSNWRFGPDRTFTLFRNAADRSRGPFLPAADAAAFAGQFTNGIVGSRGGRYVDPNPQGYGSDPQLNLIPGRTSFDWSGFDRPIGGGLGPNSTLRDYMANRDSYTVGAYASEGNLNQDAELFAARLDGNYDFTAGDGPLFGLLNRLDFGARGSVRKTQIEAYHVFSNLYAGNASNPAGCAVQWKAIDVVLDNQSGCTAGEQVPNPAFDPTQPVSAANPTTVFQGYTAYRPTKLATNNRTMFVTDFGRRANGFPGIWAADPRDFLDPLAFQNRVFGNAFPVVIPGASYDVDFYETSGYANANFELGPITGNAGLKAIRSELRVRQNLTGPTTPYGDTNSDVGDTFDRRSYWDWLPTVNLQFDASDNLKFRASFARTMIPLSLGSYGGGLQIFTSDSIGPTPQSPNNAPVGVRQVSGASAAGNPGLNPWRASNYDLTAEYYLGQATLFNISLYRVTIDSFVTTITANDGRFPDGDGVIRRDVQFTRPVQGDGGLVQGIELNAKLAASDFTQNGFLRNFGLDANYTFADSEQQNVLELRDGRRPPFFDNSTHQINVAAWYQDDDFQVRVAWNRRSPRYVGDLERIPIFQQTTNYVDLNVTWQATEYVGLFANVANLTGEYERYYLEFDRDNRQTLRFNEFEPRYSVGVRGRF